MIIKNRSIARQKVKVRVRKKIQGTPERPRLTVFRSLRHLYVQIIDDTTGNTLANSSSNSTQLSKELSGKKSMCEIAKVVGKDIAIRAKEKNISIVIFDRNGYLYHGNVKTLAESAREAGLKF